MPHMLSRAIDRTILDLCSRRHVFHVWSLLPWRNFLDAFEPAWSSPGSQHDVAEFLQFLAPASTFLACRWEARIDELGIRVEDSGTVPILLPPMAQEAEPVTIQSLIDCWMAQPSVHALIDSPSCVVLQLNRFHRQDDGQWVKSAKRVIVPQTCSVPFFDGSLLFGFRRFRFRSGVFHIGQAPTSGHYRTVLAHEDGQLYLTDDGVPAVKMTRKLEALVQANLYLCLLTLEC